MDVKHCTLSSTTADATTEACCMYNQKVSELWTQLAKLPCVANVFARLLEDTGVRSIKQVLTILVQLHPHLSILLDSQSVVLFKIPNESSTQYSVSVQDLPIELREHLFLLVQESRTHPEWFESLSALKDTALASALQLKNFTQLNCDVCEKAFSVFFENVLTQVVQSVPEDLLLETVGNIQAVLQNVYRKKQFQRVSFKTFCENCIDRQLLN